MGISYYRIYKNGAPFGVVSAGTLEFFDHLVMAGTPYAYEVHSLDTVYQEQTGCQEITVAAGGSGLLLRVSKLTEKELVLNWEGSVYPEYVVYRASNPNSFVEFGRTPDASFPDANPLPELSFYLVQQRD